MNLARENRTIIGAHQQRRWQAAQRAKAGNESVFPGNRRRAGLAAARQEFAQPFPIMAIDHQRRGRPHPSLPAQIRRRSVDQRPLGACATEGRA